MTRERRAPPEPLRVLVTGASGLLGSHLCRALAARGARVQGTAFEQPLPAGVEPIALDLTDESRLRELCRSLEVDAVVHAAAQIRVDVCQRDPAASGRLNVGAPRVLAEELGRRRRPPQLLFISSDLVFDGRRGGYREDDALAPVMIYGEQKVAAESHVRAYAGPWTIARVALLYGAGPPAHPSFLGWLDAGLRGRGVTLFQDEHRSAVYVEDVCAALVTALERPARGVYHLGGAERLSRAEFGEIYAEVCGLDVRRITRRRLGDVQHAAPRPADVSLNSALARERLDYQPRELRSALVALEASRAPSAGGAGAQ